MGIMPDDGTFNNDCPRCYPTDKTPELLKCFVSGIVYNVDNFPGLPPAPNGYVDLTQAGGGCQWSGFNDLVDFAAYSLRATESQLTIEVPGGAFAFAHTPAFTCVKHFTNARTNPAIFAYTGGWAYIATPAEMAFLIELITPIAGPDPRMELFPKANGHIVLRFANTQNGTNIEIEYDSTQF